MTKSQSLISQETKETIEIQSDLIVYIRYLNLKELRLLQTIAKELAINYTKFNTD